MATNLKLKKKCHIVPPDWLNAGAQKKHITQNTVLQERDVAYYSTEFLQDRLALETSKPEFSQLPFRFAEVAKVLLDV